MDPTILNGKRKASELDDDPQITDRQAHPQPRPFDPPLESDGDSDDDGKSSASESEARGATARAPIDDGARWLDKKRGLSGKAVHAERQQLALSGTSEIDLSSPFFRNILDEPTKSRFQMSTTAKSLDPPLKTLSKAIPKASDWDSW